MPEDANFKVSDSCGPTVHSLYCAFGQACSLKNKMYAIKVLKLSRIFKNIF